MTCSARLPVYALLIGAFFAGKGFLVQGGIMLSLYALGIAAAFATAWLFKRTLLKGPPPAFILELPTYKMPQASQVGRQVFTNTWAFLAKAGTVIFCLSVVLWAMTYYPRMSEAQAAAVKSAAIERAVADFKVELPPPPPNQPGWNERRTAELNAEFAENGAVEIGDKAVAGAQLRHSIAGRIGHFMEPALKPLGYDWKMGVGLVGAFAAREVFVSTMGIIYSAGDSEDDTTDLRAAMADDKYPDGRAVWTPAVAASLLVWFVLAMQCMSTLAIVRRETGGWKWPVFMLAYMNALAYVVALAVYQVGRMVS
jgi:ferrous iron transport protein B